MTGQYRFTRSALRLIARVLFGYRVVVSGEYPRKEGCVFASNHVSYADPIVAGIGVERELHFLAKEELFSMPVIGWWVRRHNAIPVRRGGVERTTLRVIGTLLREGGAILLFPEGTRSLDGNIARPLPGVGMIASQGKVPIYPVYVRGTCRIWLSLFRRGRLTAYIGEPVHPGDYDGFPRKERYRLIAEAVAGRMLALIEKNGR